MNVHAVEYTDTFGGEPNYSWCRRASVTMPELTHYGYDGGSGYTKANQSYQRELMRQAKARMGLTGVAGKTTHHGDTSEFRPWGSAAVLIITYVE